uniref:Uncharacterized protein n=1 Tax=Parascaris equorum TaxID=6256 RepID=A0A914R6G3_PAREQ
MSKESAEAAHSTDELSFILGVRPAISVLVWSDESDTIDSWTSLIELRSGPHSKRLIFDLHPKHRAMLKTLPYILTIVSVYLYMEVVSSLLTGVVQITMRFHYLDAELFIVYSTLN